MARPTPLSGFPELLPAERIAEQHVLDHLRATFELHGFASVETRAVEPMEQLLRKGEIDKEVYVLRRLQAEDSEGDARLGLHFDLTVPFARYVLEKAGHLDFPFRRYQIQKVWRGERPQEGRFREFTQADIDVVARDVLPFHFDVEIASVMAEALAGLPLPPVRLQLSNRKLLEGFYRGLGAEDPTAVMRVMDKLDKLDETGIRTLLAECGLDEQQAGLCLALAEVVTEDTAFVDRVRALGVTDPMLDEGLADLAEVVGSLTDLGLDGVTVTADLRIARGLDYYTGTVFETMLEGYESLGSICSGGRYEALASDGRNVFPGVGISLGVTRMVVPLVARGALTASRSVPSVVLVAVSDEASRPRSNAIARALRGRGIACEVAPSAAKFGKQIRHADRRGIPYVWFPAAADPTGDAGDEVKDIRSGEQVVADAATWTPPTADLRPQVVTKETAQ
ncbi:histidyl-tRNA synthetase [Mumia flava]|uniref:Histidine--tRNA ligase n=1 Tax=Mumia flava TaxID=1348852 RepID=A0A0B2B881_9ACTN|nr:histidine--tRNA ligase [Mumia flava]PJJ55871.1 histidyl-tRNA synthetase [Mumia flava]